MIREPLTRTQVIQAIERTGQKAKIPLVHHKWWGNGLKEKYGEKLTELENKYPDDIVLAPYQTPGEEQSPNRNASYR